ncbi:MAG: DUF3560 domain-containing protein [Bdellovibrionales bacterium]|nr:DUF3560 domain-containing protein [Ramlibacter sp.]
MYDLSATYSPEDNKLRLYSSTRLDKETYARVAAQGFRYAPKQGFFVAPMWTPEREDLLTELCGEVGDEDSTLVQRAEERADRFEDYSESRQRDADSARSSARSIMGRFEFGQPILVGHHSERKARKDAERIENGMRRAVKMWETSQYWKDRAAGALAHAKYKELPEVRARRIKGLESDKRKQERNIEEATKWLNAWSRPDLTLEQALNLANYCHLTLPRKEGDRPDFDGRPSVHTALTNSYPNLYAPRTLAEVVEHAKKVYPRVIAHAQRWLDHYENRIAYERAMLDEAGGLAAERFTIAVGGRVLVDGEWVAVLRLNKSGGRVVSLTVARRYVSRVGIEEVKDYQAPTQEQAERVKAATKVAPLTNYPGEEFIHITQAEWDAIGKDYRGTDTKPASETAGRHRVRRALGVFLPRLTAPEGADGTQRANHRHRYHDVFITDAKRVNAPAAPQAENAAPATVPAPEPVAPRPAVVHQPRERTEFDDMRDQLRHGVKVVSAPQLFPTPSDLAARMVDLAGVDVGLRVLEPSAGTGQILAALPGVVPFGEKRQTALDVVAVEYSHALAEGLKQSGLAGSVVCGDFLQCRDELGKFDAVLMNPPFENAADIKHITHALTMLKPGGRLVAICANGPRQNDALRPMVEAAGGHWEVLPSGTFDGTGVSSVLMAFTKA